MNTITHTTEFKIETCCNCAIPFAMPEQLYKTRLEDAGWFYCPNGHGQHYNKRKRLEEELDLKRKELSAARCEILAEKAKLEHLQKNHNRLVKNGVCPCCRRSFINLKRHMNTKHPEYIKNPL